MPDSTGESVELRVVIVDDEPLARDCMRLALRGSAVEIVAECADGEAAVEAIRQHMPDAVLLDVQMPGLDGFGVIERVGPESMPAVVFVTAFDAHAIRAFDVQALDYVLKPFADERLRSAMQRVRAKMSDQRSGELAQRLDALVRDWNGRRGAGCTRTAGDAATDDETEWTPAAPAARGRTRRLTRFTVRHDGRMRFVPVADVDWIEADGNYVVLHVGVARHRLRATVNQIAAQLDPERFVRVHRSAIVNIDRVCEVQRWLGGDYIAILHSGIRLRVSRLRAAELLRPFP